ncbi:exostosin domain-containing protein [Synoicihabitans lomoniglobus]|uniref:Exostosin family protein n=1 Tax=Synoicihabitans lomoniglobus TaxID=2909285 RepID=A0AAE9ZWL2_9BACT|nr:glycosyltransferase family 47 protein [Opitutaceae bacterium LMO-M01]WED65487.1 exostosin family protein [Opitutaceae bacterium LMO-M01]
MSTDVNEPENGEGPVKIYIDLEGHGYYFRREMERLVEAISAAPSTDGVLVGSRDASDCVIRLTGCPSLRDKMSTCLKWPEQKSPREFVWDMGDLPTGGPPGFYVSLPSYMFERRRHRAFGLPIKCNEVIRPYDLRDATFLYGFLGAITSGVRGRMLPMLNALNESREGLLVVRDSIWHKMFDRSGLQGKQDYADTMRRCRFNLCPRGNVLAGTGSRLYETMQAARVPVIISDWMTLPEGVDWDSCSVRVKEREMSNIPQILRSYLDRWPEMALNARRAWEMHFSDAALVGELGRQLRSLLAWNGEQKLSTRLSGRGRIALGLLSWKGRQGYTSLNRLKQRMQERRKS